MTFPVGSRVRVLSSPSGRFIGREGEVSDGESVVRVVFDPVAGVAASFWHEDLALVEDEGCEGHPAGPFDPMGETVFCDGSCVAARRRDELQEQADAIYAARTDVGRRP